MDIRKILIGLALTLILMAATGAAMAQPGGWTPPPPGMFHRMGLSGISGDAQYLYVLAGGKILQYSLADLKLVKSVDLPKPVPPSNLTSKDQQAMPFPPPPMGGPHGLYAGEGFLCVLAGPMIHRYSTPDLTLLTSVELPKPDPPTASN